MSILKMTSERADRQIQVAATKSTFDDLIDTHAKAYLAAYPEIKEFSDFDISATPKYCIGMVWTRECERPDPQQIRIRGSKALAQNKMIELDLSAVYTEQTFFPGQIVAFQAELRKLAHVKKFLDATRIAPPLKPLNFEDGDTKRLLVASGPYMAIDKEDWTLFDKLIESVKSNKATHVILVGPFVDIENEHMIAQYDVNWKIIFDKIIEGLYDHECHVYLVPSNRDILPSYLETNYLYPMARVNFKQVLKPDIKPKCVIEPVTDPAQIDLGGIYAEVSSAEVLLHLSQYTASINKAANIFTSIYRHLITYGVYPIYPSTKDMAVDYSRLYSHLRVDRVGSHIVIVPSRTSTNVSEVENRRVVAINRFSTKRVAVLMEIPELTHQVLEIR